ncbi:uncharacterized protein ATC70_006590 [Mucor velutinosus]|uniref:C2H2-type domain-containing protein n=1 Tax=Mucor velutinosus TaxID=708070 RepID=A0AAN7DNP8_9FUNG|nr:hypothetical protein ATC70_006590 [Mucor velutinosus]
MASLYELLDNPIDFNQIKPSVDTSHLGLLWNDINVLLYDEFCALSPCFSAAVAAPDSPIWSTSTSPTSSISSGSCSGSRQASPSPIEENTTFFDLMAAVDEEKPHRCLYCIRAFSRRHDLERHVRVHTGVKPYHCPCCQKSFARSDARGRHFQSNPLCSQNDLVQKLIHKRKARTTNIKRY